MPEAQRAALAGEVCRVHGVFECLGADDLSFTIAETVRGERQPAIQTVGILEHDERRAALANRFHHVFHVLFVWLLAVVILVIGPLHHGPEALPPPAAP